jgi:hypothetical protein
MENMNKLYIGQKSRPETCPVCLRTKENAIAEQLQAGKPCGHEKCGFKSEIELISTILEAPDLEQIKTLTSESIETSKKTYDLLVALRESVREMKESFRNETDKDNRVTNSANPPSKNNSGDRTIEITDDQLQSILERIDLATRTMSRLIEKGYEKPSSESQEPEDIDEAILSLQELGKKGEQDTKQLNEYIKSREEFNRKLAAGWEKVDEALKRMREVVQVMEEESLQEKAAEPDHNSISRLADKLAHLFHLKNRKT